jgi:hypothetical protein
MVFLKMNKLNRLYEKVMKEGSSESDELLLYINNDGKLYQQYTKPIEKNLSKKHKAGTYNSMGGVKAFQSLVDEAAKRFAKENNGDWKQMFSVSDRLNVAKELAKYFEREAKLGNYTESVELDSMYEKVDLTSTTGNNFKNLKLNDIIKDNGGRDIKKNPNGEIEFTVKGTKYILTDNSGEVNVTEYSKKHKGSIYFGNNIQYKQFVDDFKSML